MKFRLLPLVAFLIATGPAQAEIKLPQIDNFLQRYEVRLADVARNDTRSSFDLLRQIRDATANGRTDLVIELLEILAGKQQTLGEGFGPWLRLALALQSKGVDQANAASRASAAAYGAYKRARTDTERIEALSVLSAASPVSPARPARPATTPPATIANDWLASATAS